MVTRRYDCIVVVVVEWSFGRWKELRLGAFGEQAQITGILLTCVTRNEAVHG